MLLGLIGSISPKVKASPTFIVTETASEFIVENDYYIAHIPILNTTAGGGTIREFYIKPQTSTNIVSHGGFTSLGGMEYGEYNGTSLWTCGTWGTPTGIKNFSATKVYETSNVVTIRTQIIWRTSVDRGRPNATLTIYHTFYDEPYYLVTMTRLQEDDYAQLFNSQICFLFDTNYFWDCKQPNTWYSINRETGDAEQDGGARTYLNEASIYGKMPWFWVYNSTLNTGFGTILLDAYPRPMECFLGFVAGGGVGRYSEYQIDLTLHAERQNEPTTVSFLCYAKDTTDYSYIETLATDLYQSRKSTITSDDANFPVAFNYKHGTTLYNTFGRPMIGFKLRPIGNAGWGFKGFDSVSNWQSCFFRIVNATDTYTLNDWTTTTVTGSQNQTYAKVLWNHVYEGKLNSTAQFEVWDDSDTMKFTFILETETAINLTDAYFEWNSGSSKALWTTFAGENDYVKLNTTDYKGWIPSFLREEAYIAKNLTNTARTSSYLISKWFWVDNSGDVEYSSGQQWTIQLYVQYFKRYTAWDTEYVGVSDFHEPNEHNSEREAYNYQNWLPLPLFSQEENLMINRVGTTKSQLAYSAFNNDILTLVFVGDTGATTTRQIYCGDKGEPTSVSGASTWSYDDSEKILTLAIEHPGSESIEIRWDETSAGIYKLTVNVKQSGSPLPNVNVTVNGETEQTNSSGIATFKLSYGHYTVQATHGVETRTVHVLVNRDKTVLITFGKAKKTKR